MDWVFNLKCKHALSRLQATRFELGLCLNWLMKCQTRVLLTLAHIKYDFIDGDGVQWKELILHNAMNHCSNIFWD